MDEKLGTCNNCCWGDLHLSGVLVCRRNPPTFDYRWPEVLPSDWCGQWSPDLISERVSINNYAGKNSISLPQCSPTNRHTVICKCDGRGIVPNIPGMTGAARLCDCEKCEGTYE